MMGKIERELSKWRWMGPGGPRGLQSRCEARRTSWVCSIRTHLRHYSRGSSLRRSYLRKAWCYIFVPQENLQDSRSFHSPLGYTASKRLTGKSEFMFTYFKRYEIAACVISGCDSPCRDLYLVDYRGRAMSFTAAGAGVSVRVVARRLVRFHARVRSCRTREAQLVSLTTTIAMLRPSLEGSSKIAQIRRAALGNFPRGFCPSTRAHSSTSTARARPRNSASLMIQDSVKDAPTDEAKIALYAISRYPW